jgi:membrane fusion protein, multidrug efflux system
MGQRTAARDAAHRPAAERGEPAPRDIAAHEVEARTTAEAPQRDPDAKHPAGKRPVDAPETIPAPTAERPSLRERARRHPLLVAAAAVAAAIAVVAGVLWWLSARQYESTDDAFIDARTVSISSQVNGAIVDVPVTDNQIVDTGGVLARIDQRDYVAAVNQAKAQVEQAQANVANLAAQISAQQARIDQAQKQVTEAQGALTFSQQQNRRAQDLVQKGAGTVQAAQQASSDLIQKQAAMSAAQANLIAAQKQIAVLQTQQEVAKAQIDQARAAQDTAEANLSRTVITAPVNGQVTHLTAAKGQYASAGQALMMFVPTDKWITANFKETQLDKMRPGEPVDISIDAYPGRTFRGHVDSIQAGSGTAFSLLPAENATGNFVKVVQRVPVKIVFDTPPDVYLGPGMSVVPSVKVR